MVEDNPTNQIVAVGLLKKIGFVNVTVAGNGKEAVDQASSGDSVAILMDCQMPVMDGYTATEILRAKGCATPIIAMTANASPADSQRCRAVGMNGYISKPMTSASLQKALKQSIPAAAEEQMAVASDSQTLTAEELSVFGRETALNRMGGDADLLNAVVSSFTEQMPITMRELEKALENNDSEVAARHLHSLLGSSASVSALQTHALLKIMNDAVAQGDTHLVRQNMPALQGCLALFINTAAGG